MNSYPSNHAELYWRPIETAPKDGAEEILVLLDIDCCTGTSTATTFWDEENGEWFGDFYFSWCRFLVD